MEHDYPISIKKHDSKGISLHFNLRRFDIHGILRECLRLFHAVPNLSGMKTCTLNFKPSDFVLFILLIIRVDHRSFF